MDFRQLEAFVTVVSTGSMTAAARVLGTSQPTITRLVQELEHSVGFQLLTRNGPKIIPTRDGLDFYAEADGLLNAVSRLENRAHDIATAAPPSFDIASISSVGVAFVPKILARMNPAKVPDKISISLQRAEVVPQMVVNGQADLGFANPPLDHPGLENRWLLCSPLRGSFARRSPSGKQKADQDRRLQRPAFLLRWVTGFASGDWLMMHWLSREFRSSRKLPVLQRSPPCIASSPEQQWELLIH